MSTDRAALKRVLRVGLIVVASAVVVLGLALAATPRWRALVLQAFEPADPSLALVTNEQSLRDAFNRRADRTRVVAWLSPT